MSFKNRFILAFVLTQAIFIFFTVYLNFSLFNKNFDEMTNEKISSTNLLFKSSLREPLFNFRIDTIQDVLDDARTLELIEFIEVFTKENTLLVSNAEKSDELFSDEDFILDQNIYKSYGDMHYILYRAKISNEEQVLGFVNIAYNITSVIQNAEFREKATYGLILIEILVCLIIALLVSKNFTEKLDNLALSAQKISNLNNDLIPYTNDKDEIGELSKSLANLKDQIRKRNKKLVIYEKMFSHTKEAIILTNSKGSIIDVNDAFVDLTGYQRVEVLGKKPTFVKTEKYKKKYNKSLLKELTKDGYWSGEVFNKRKNKESYLSFLNISSIKNDLGKVVNYLIIASDITSLKEKESIFQAQAKMATLGEMLANIAHQWRQPLSSITSISSSSIIQNEMNLISKEDLTKNFEAIIDTSKYLSNTIDDFRNFFNKDKKISTTTINHTIDSTINILKATLVQNHISVQIEIDDDIEIVTYENELIQTLINIINNAKDVLVNKKQSRVIRISVKNSAKNIFLDITDNAGGIPEKIMDKIFEPYFTTKHQSQGTGIGLYMTHVIVNEHLQGSIMVNNVNIDFDNKTYKGAKFSIALPQSIV